MILKINGKELQYEAERSMPLLWVLRDVLHMTGTNSCLWSMHSTY